MVVIGVTGRTCAGKDVVTQALREKQVPIIDVDALGHQALVANKAELAEAFGPGILGPDGSIDRKALGRIVFANPQKLKMLEAINHPWMKGECTRQIELLKGEGKNAIVLNAALLHRMKLDVLCTHIIFVHASWWRRAWRARKRDGLSLRQFLHRNRAQKDIAPTLMDGPAKVFTVNNKGERAIIYRQVLLLCARIIPESVSQGIGGHTFTEE